MILPNILTVDVLNLMKIRFFSIILLTVAAYWMATQAGFIWDDDDYIIDNLLLQTLDGLWRIWSTTETPQYYPLVFTTFWIEYQLWELQPQGYHIINILLHALNACLIGYILQLLKVKGAWWIAAIFAVHPVHVESVAWITERKNVLSGLFYLLAFLYYCHFNMQGKRRCYWISLGLFVMALLSKTVTSTLPVVLVLMLHYQNKRWRRLDLYHLAPFFLMALGMGLLTIWLEKTHVGASGAEFDFSWVQRLTVACRALLFYAQKLLIPYPLMFNYPRWELDIGLWHNLSSLFTVVLLAGAFFGIWKSRYQPITYPVAYYGITLFPALGFFNVFPFRYSFVADHFQYLASLGLLILYVQTGIWFANQASFALKKAAEALSFVKMPEQQLKRFCANGMMMILLLILGCLTWKQTLIYKNLETLWEDTIAKNPHSWMALINLGAVYMERNQNQTAIEYFNRAIEINSSNSEAYIDRGLAYLNLRQYSNALEDHSRAVEIDPKYHRAYMMRGLTYFHLQQYAKALQDYNQTIVMDPANALAYNHRGALYNRLKQYELALQNLNRSIQLDSHNSSAYINRGIVYIHQQQYEHAMNDFNQAVQLAPDEPDVYQNRGSLFLLIRQYKQAMADFDKVVALNPAKSKAYLHRGSMYMMVWKNKEKACLNWDKACQLGECRNYDLAKKTGDCP
ncbi:MAG: tetratricopeptide repeat protein [SAR324 cluster bacterium]|nr:tetratricopeptide repeat protein [SAR324 cluster bacterium]